MGQINFESTKEDLLVSNTHKQRVVNLLKQNPSGLTGLTIADMLKNAKHFLHAKNFQKNFFSVSKKAGASCHTASIILAELKGADFIDIRKIGMAKLHNWRENLQ